ncbi:MAG TPA: hypothetical protein VG916_04420, partial [Gemmatimonadaceae bacterium]|nr:hypothetical protein [Gemmatimonadaceae bacterium]
MNARALATMVVGSMLSGVAPGLAARPDARPAGGAAARPAPAPYAFAPRLAIARLQYDGGGDWYANPSSLP